MEIAVSRSAAVEAIKRVATFAGRMSGNPMSFLKFVAGADSVTVTSNGVEGQCHVSIEAKVKEPGEMLVKADMLVALASRLNSSEFTLKTGKADITLKAGSNRYRLPTYPDPTAYPDTVKATGEVVHLPAKQFLELLSFASHAMAIQDVRYFLCGVRLHASGKKISASGTDGHRAAVAEATLDEALSGELVATIPAGTVQKLLTTLSSAGQIAVSVSDGRSLFVEDASGMRFHGVLVDGQYPDIARVVPEKAKCIGIKVNAATLRGALERARVMSSDTKVKKGVLIGADSDDALSVQLDTADSGMVEKVEVEGKPFDMAGYGLNPSYLHDALSAMPDDEVMLMIPTTVGGAVRLDGIATSGRTSVIMPLRA